MGNIEIIKKTSLKEDLPEYLGQFLINQGTDLSKVKICISSDMSGENCEKDYLLVTDEKLMILSTKDGNNPFIKKSFILREIREVHSTILLGRQILEIDSDGGTYEVMKYKNEVAEKFTAAIRVLNAILTKPGLKKKIDEYITLAEEDLKKSITTEIPIKEKRRIFHRLLKMTKPYWFSIILMIILLLTGVAIDLTPPYLTKILIDDVLGPNAKHPHLLLPLVLGLLGIQFARIIITIVSNRINTVVGNRFVFDLRNALFEKLQKLSISFFDHKQVGGLTSRISSDTEVLQSFITNLSQGLLLNIVLVLGIGFVLFSMDWRLGLFILLPGPLVMLASRYYWKFIRVFYDRYWFSRWRINSFLNACLSGIKIVKMCGQENKEIKNFISRNTKLVEDALAINRSWSTFFPIISFVFGVGGLLVWYVGGRFVLADHISLGTLIAFLSYLGMFYGPLSQLTHVTQWATQLFTAGSRIFEILDSQEVLPKPKNPVRLFEVKGRIELKNVSFGYKKYLPVLHDISFRVEPCETIGIIGPSGAGKTTIVNLICRFYDVSEGCILLDGIDIRQIDEDDLRRYISIVPQEPYLFRGTILENIAYAKPSATFEEIVEAAKISYAHDFIVQFPEGYETRIGERGSGLSGGERQRISIARAILKNPKILILDEATTSVDAESENLIQKALSSLIKNCTTFIIAHKLSTLQNVDKIMTIRNGRLEEFGRPEDLIKQDGYYRRFVRAQIEIFKLKNDYDYISDEYIQTEFQSQVC